MMCERKKGSGTNSAKHPKGRSGYWYLTPFSKRLHEKWKCVSTRLLRHLRLNWRKMEVLRERLDRIRPLVPGYSTPHLLRLAISQDDSMNTYELNRRQALIAGGMGALSLGMPGSVIGNDKLDSSGNAVAAEKSCIFVLLCGGPSHVDTWDMKPNAPDTIRGPYKPISTKVPGMRINEMHTQLAKVTDQFTLINSMTHPGAISNHFDAMHNLLSGQSAKRVQQGVSDDQPYLGSFVAKHKPSKRNIVSNAWLIKCVGPPVFCAEHWHRWLPRFSLRTGVRRFCDEPSGDGEFCAAADL